MTEAIPIPEVPPRISPKRWLAVLHLAKRECGNCSSFDRAMGQLSLARIKHFAQVMRHVPPTEIGRPDPMGVLVRKQHKLSPALEELHDKLRELETQIEHSHERERTTQLAHERAAVEASIGKIFAENAELADLERQIEALENSRESHVTQPEELWVNYGQCNALKKIVYSGWNCKAAGEKKWA